MHILLYVSGMLVVIVLGSVLILCLLRLFSDWSQRQLMQLLVLMTPLVSLIVLLGGLQHVLNADCALNAPTWDYTVDVTVLLLVGSNIVGALGLGLGRLILMKRVMRQQEVIADPDLQALVDQFAQQSGLSRLCLQLARSDRPFALLYGIRRPTILLSTWMIEHLDRQELEAVLMHELVHARRRDYLMNWVALLLRDAFFYLPTSRIAYRQLHHEKELVCDDLVAQATQRPLALASALTKVWLHLVDDSPSQIAQTLFGRGESIADRVDRLLGMRNPTLGQPSMRFFSLSVGTSISVVLMDIAVSLAFTVALLNC
jgi:beta-lactamase regulating signal transducer with metallopeptidase domain